MPEIARDDKVQHLSVRPLKRRKGRVGTESKLVSFAIRKTEGYFATSLIFTAPRAEQGDTVPRVRKL